MVIVFKESLWLLLILVPVLILLIRARNASLTQVHILCGSQWIRKQGRRLHAKLVITSTITLLMFCFIVFAYADVYQGKTSIRRERAGVELGFLIDVSNSMLAADVYPSRMQRVQVFVQSIVNNFPDTWYSLSIFKGEATTLIPMTQDRLLLQQTIPILQPNIMSKPGSNIAAGIKVAAQGTSSLSDRNQIIVVLSDGEQVNANKTAALHEARRSGKKFILVGIGTKEGSTIRSDDDTFVTAKDGKRVLTRLNSELLESIATTTGGLYVEESNEDSFSTIVSYIETLQNSNIQVEQTNTPRYPLFVTGVLVCLMLTLGVGFIPWRE